MKKIFFTTTQILKALNDGINDSNNKIVFFDGEYYQDVAGIPEHYDLESGLIIEIATEVRSISPSDLMEYISDKVEMDADCHFKSYMMELFEPYNEGGYDFGDIFDDSKSELFEQLNKLLYDVSYNFIKKNPGVLSKDSEFFRIERNKKFILRDNMSWEEATADDIVKEKKDELEARVKAVKDDLRRENILGKLSSEEIKILGL